MTVINKRYGAGDKLAEAAICEEIAEVADLIMKNLIFRVGIETEEREEFEAVIAGVLQLAYEGHFDELKAKKNAR